MNKQNPAMVWNYAVGLSDDHNETLDEDSQSSELSVLSGFSEIETEMDNDLNKDNEKEIGNSDTEMEENDKEKNFLESGLAGLGRTDLEILRTGPDWRPD